MSELVNNLKEIDSVTFGITPVSKSRINKQAVELVNKYLPELDKKSKYFDRSNSQSMLSLMSLTMLNGQSPMRMLRQVLTEAESRKIALASSQVGHAKLLDKIDDLREKLVLDPDNRLAQAELREAYVSIEILESKINGAFKDIATLINAYNNLKEKWNIDDWTEEDFEESENKYHVRRCFELMYRNILDTGRANTGTIEYMQQYGIHPQVGYVEIQGYMAVVNEMLSEGKIPHANHLEEFLDSLANKYYSESSKTINRIYGKENIIDKNIFTPTDN